MTRVNPILRSTFGEFARLRKEYLRRGQLEATYCAETVAITYEDMGLLSTYKHTNWFDPGSFWSGRRLPLAPGYVLGEEIAVAD
jgi:hypothetical protein